MNLSHMGMIALQVTKNLDYWIKERAKNQRGWNELNGRSQKGFNNYDLIKETRRHGRLIFIPLLSRLEVLQIQIRN